MTDDLRQAAIDLYDRFTHEHGDRRRFLSELTALAGSAAAANVVMAGIAAGPATAALTSPADKRLRTQALSWPVAEGRTMRGYTARPAGAASKRGVVLVVHENRGLNDHIRDVARRVALEGFVAVAPDFLSIAGGTPADEDAAREAIGKLDLNQSVADGVASIAHFRRVAQSNGKVAAVGFCWGGAMVNRLAASAGTSLTAGIPYYGPAPAPERAARVKAAMLLHYAGLDTRVNATAQPWIDALKAANVPAQAYFYEGANHAFNNDTSAERYNKAAAELAWSRTIAFLRARLA